MSNNCPPELGHVWERVTTPSWKHDQLTATVACTREGCDEVGVEIINEKRAS